MKRILAFSALLALFSGAALADNAFNTTGGYGNPILDARGAGYVSVDGLRATYSYVASDITPVATATDVVVITGSATKTVRISRVCFGGSATAASIYDVYMYKRTVADTGGTATNPTPTQHDSNDAAASAVVSLYTANPTVGTGTLIRGSKTFLINGATPVGGTPLTCWDFGIGVERPTLRGVAQQFAINHGAGAQAVPAGASVYYNVEWTEE